MKKFGKFFGFGVITTLIEYIVFTIVARILSNDFLWLATLIGGIVGVVASFILNTEFVWKDKKAGKSEAAEVLGYGMVKTFVFKEFFTWVFTLITPVYELAFSISSAIHLPFDYDFVESTGVFGFTAVATMFITYFVYDKMIFTKNKEKNHGKNINMESVREAREEHERNKEGNAD